MNHDNPVHIRLAKPMDSAEIFRLVDFSRDTLMVRFPWAADATLDSIWAYINSKLNSVTDTMYVIERPKIGTGKEPIVGVIETRDKHFNYQIGYWIDDRFCGRGYATSALMQMIRRVPKPVTAQIRHDNKASLNVMQHAGMHLIDADAEWRYFSSLTKLS